MLFLADSIKWGLLKTFVFQVYFIESLPEKKKRKLINLASFLGSFFTCLVLCYFFSEMENFSLFGVLKKKHKNNELNWLSSEDSLDLVSLKKKFLAKIMASFAFYGKKSTILSSLNNYPNLKLVYYQVWIYSSRKIWQF